MNKRLFFTGFFFFLLIGAMVARNALASHHKAQIAFVSTRDGNSEIYVMDGGGNNQIRLTNHPEVDYQPSWSPDGARIAFVSNRNGGNEQIYVMDSNGKNVKLLTNGILGSYPVWSPDGQTIAYNGRVKDDWVEEEHSGIILIAPDGSNRRILAGDIPVLDGEPAWSPDSQRIAFVSWREDWTGDIGVMDADGRNPKRLTHTPNNERHPAWSPDGSKIAFTTVPEEDFVLSVMDADGTNQRILTEEVLDGRMQLIFHPAWSPDGRTIAYHFGQGLNGGIHLITADGEYLKRLGDVHKGGDSWPDWFAAASLAVFPASKQLTIWGKLKKLAAKLR